MADLDQALADDALHEQRRMHEDQRCACGNFDDADLPDHGCVLAAEVERLRDGIREHRDHDFKGDPFITGPARYVDEIRRVNERLWSLLGVATDDGEDGT